MKLFAYTFVGTAKDWFDVISPKTITNWNFFQELFTKRFGKKREITNPCIISSTNAKENQGKI
jgi:hypothetical protein